MASLTRAYPLEQEIKRDIVTYLKMMGAFVWVTTNVGVYDKASGSYRRMSGSQMRGVADVIGVFRKRPLAVEVKSHRGKLSPFQEEFLRRFAESGGIAIVARSVQDVQIGLINAFKELT